MKLALSAIVMMMFSTQAFGYGAAGCGWGSILFEGKTQWYEQVLAATTNGSSGSQTFGITSGTVNCDATPLIKISHLETFIESNKNTVATDLSRGNGDSITVLSYAFNCKDSSALSSSLQKNYSSIYNGQSDSSANVANRINKVVASVPNCATI